MAYEYPTALDYARLSVVALEACGESAGACLSRLEMAWHYVYLGDEAAALDEILLHQSPQMDSLTSGDQESHESEEESDEWEE